MSDHCRLLVPDGSMEKVVHQLLEDAGLGVVYGNPRNYLGIISDSDLFPKPDNLATKMRPQDATWMVADKKAELAFSGDDLIAESTRASDLRILRRYPLSRGGVGKTRVVLAVPNDSPIQSAADLKPDHELVTEYPRIAQSWLTKQKVEPRIRVCHGSLEAFNSAVDAAIENVESGQSLKINGWREISTIMESQLCLITYPEAMQTFQDTKKNRSKEVIETVGLLLDSVIQARPRAIIKCNIPFDRQLAVIGKLKLEVEKERPGDVPTVNKNECGRYAVEVVVLKSEVGRIISYLKADGATAIVVTAIDQYVP